MKFAMVRMWMSLRNKKSLNCRKQLREKVEIFTCLSDLPIYILADSRRFCNDTI